MRLPKLLDAIQWNTKLKLGNTLLDPCHLAELFASSRISPSVMDAVMDLISICVANTSSIRRIIVEDSRVERGLRSDACEWDMYGESRELEALHKIGNRIKDENVKALIFSMLVHGNRWAVFEIDFENQLVCYGDPAGQDPVEIDLQPIRRWLNALGYPEFALRHFEHELQDDDYSCGVMVWNMVEHRLFSDTLWATETKQLLRASYAFRLLDLSNGNPLPLIISPKLEPVSIRS